MTTPAPPNAQMPPLPVVAHLVINDCGDSWVQKHPGAYPSNAEPLCKVSDAQAYAAQRTAELEAKLAAAEKRVAELVGSFQDIYDDINPEPLYPNYRTKHPEKCIDLVLEAVRKTLTPKV